MLHAAVALFLSGLVAAWFGFIGIAVPAVAVAKVLFVSFVVLSIARFFAGVWRQQHSAADR